MILKRYQIKKFFLLTAILGLLSCGMEEYYYLPQVPDNVFRTLNTEAIFTINSGLLNGHYYATGYRIFYRIYLSSQPAGYYPNLNIINQRLLNDYNFFQPFTDPSLSSSIINSNTFANHGFYELDILIPTSGGSIEIIFQTGTVIDDRPFIKINNGQPITLLRSTRLTSPLPLNDRSLVNSTELNNPANATREINADVVAGNAGHAYIAMYIAAIGTHPENLSRLISSKPTFIHVFKLPDRGN